MRVGALCIGNIAEHSLADHVEDGEIIPAETPVFEHHARGLSLFLGVDDFPALVDSIGNGNLTAGIYLRLHRVGRHAHVPLPRCGNKHAVEIAAFQHSFVIHIAPRVALRLGPARVGHHLLGVRQMFEVDVTEGWDFHLFKQGQEPSQAGAAVSRPNHAETNAPPGSQATSRKRDSRARHTDKFSSIHGAYFFLPEGRPIDFCRTVRQPSYRAAAYSSSSMNVINLTSFSAPVSPSTPGIFGPAPECHN